MGRPSTGLWYARCYISDGGSPESITPETGGVVEQGDYFAALKLIDSVKKLDRSIIRKKAGERYEASEKYDEYFSLYKSMISNI